MRESRLISMHPRLAAAVDALVSLASVWWIANIDNVGLLALWFFLRIAWWGLLVNFVYYPPYLSRWKHFLALILGNIGSLSFLVFSDPSGLLASKIFAVLISCTSFWLIPSRADSLSVMEKPHRRWKFFMSLFSVSGIFLAFFATSVFQIISGTEVVYAMASSVALVTIISMWEWFEYGVVIGRKMYVSSAVLSLLLAELLVIIFLWPIGYFVAGFLATWLWYVSWLLFRFNMTSTGIDWSKQRAFLFSNLLFVVIFLLFIVRWK